MNKEVTIAIKVTEELAERLKELADQDNRTMSGLVRHVLTVYVEQ